MDDKNRMILFSAILSWTGSIALASLITLFLLLVLTAIGSPSDGAPITRFALISGVGVIGALLILNPIITMKFYNYKRIRINYSKGLLYYILSIGYFFITFLLINLLLTLLNLPIWFSILIVVILLAGSSGLTSTGMYDRQLKDTEEQSTINDIIR